MERRQVPDFNLTSKITIMKFLPIISMLSLVLMAYWLIKDMPWFIAFKDWVKKFLYRCGDLFTNFVERVNDDVELY